jgi:hypothetical protein
MDLDSSFDVEKKAKTWRLLANDFLMLGAYEDSLKAITMANEVSRVTPKQNTEVHQLI